MADSISSRQRAELRSRAQNMSPLVMVGHDGLTDGVVSMLDKALLDHELVKVRFQDFKDRTKDLSAELAERTKAVLVATTGFTAVMYRYNPEKHQNTRARH